MTHRFDGNRRFGRWSANCGSVILAAIVLAPQLAAAQKTWQGLSGERWLDPTNWPNDELPTAADDVRIMAANSPPVIDGSATSRDLTLDAAASVRIESFSLLVSGDTLTNDGSILVDANNDPGVSTLRVASGATIDAVSTGEMLLYENSIFNATQHDSAVIHGANHTIRGDGDLLAPFINNGTITADDLDASGSSALHLGTGGGFGGPNGFVRTNNGVIQSSAGSDLELAIALDQTGGGQLVADGGEVRLMTSRILGGSLVSQNGGVFRTTGNALWLDSVTLAGQLNLVSQGGAAGVARIYGSGLTNNGTILMNELVTGNAFLVFAESGTIDGVGEIVMNLEGFGAQIESTGGAVGTLAAGQTVRGTGLVEADLVNNGTIIAEPLNGTILELLLFPKQNNATIRADAGALLRIRNVSVTQDDANGEIVANGGTVELDANGRIIGGRLEATGAGVFTVRTNGYLRDVTNNAPFVVPSGNNPLRLEGSTLTNNNTMTVNNSVIVESNLLLGGSGEIALPNDGNGSQVRIADNVTLTQAPGHVIRGRGQVFATGETFINNGRLEGNSASELLEIRGLRLGGSGVLDDVEIGFTATHAPGESTAIVPLEGVYDLTFNATLEMEVGGLAPGDDYDQLSSTGSVNLAGVLNVLDMPLDNGYEPAAGDRFDIITSSGSDITGTFRSVNLTSVLGGRLVTWQPVDYATDPKKVTLELASVSFFAADFDEDADVDVADLAAWESGFGITNGAAHGDGDATGEGAVNGADFLTWQRQYGIGLPAAAASSAVPEPTAAGLVCIVAAAIGMCGAAHRLRVGGRTG